VVGCFIPTECSATRAWPQLRVTTHAAGVNCLNCHGGAPVPLRMRCAPHQRTQKLNRRGVKGLGVTSSKSGCVLTGGAGSGASLGTSTVSPSGPAFTCPVSLTRLALPAAVNPTGGTAVDTDQLLDTCGEEDTTGQAQSHKPMGAVACVSPHPEDRSVGGKTHQRCCGLQRDELLPGHHHGRGPPQLHTTHRMNVSMPHMNVNVRESTRAGYDTGWNRGYASPLVALPLATYRVTVPFYQSYIHSFKRADVVDTRRRLRERAQGAPVRFVNSHGRTCHTPGYLGLGSALDGRLGKSSRRMVTPSSPASPRVSSVGALPSAPLLLAPLPAGTVREKTVGGTVKEAHIVVGHSGGHSGRHSERDTLGETQWGSVDPPQEPAPHAPVLRRPPNSCTRIGDRSEGYTYAAKG
jgi:hypothetical protein